MNIARIVSLQLSLACLLACDARSPAAPAPDRLDLIEGRVVERVDSPPYAFLRVETAAGHVWTAVPIGGAGLGADVRLSGPGALACRSESDLEQSQPKVRFEYDAFNRRVARLDGSTWTAFLHDPAGNLLAELARPSGSSTWSSSRDYVWLDGLPLAQLDYPGPAGRSDGYTYYFHLDHLGPFGGGAEVVPISASAASSPADHIRSAVRSHRGNRHWRPRTSQS